MNFIVILAIAIFILYWFKQKGVKKDREIVMEKRRREMKQLEEMQKKEDREIIRQLKEEIEDLKDKLDGDGY